MCGSTRLSMTKKAAIAAAVGASVFMIVPGCAYGCPPGQCSGDYDAGTGDAHVPSKPTVVEDAAVEAGSLDASTDAKLDATLDTGASDASPDGN